MKVLVRDRNAPIIQLFYVEKNETVISAGLGALADTKMIYRPQATDAPSTSSRDIALWDAHYAYPGKTPTRPQSVSFTFFINQDIHRYERDQSFTVSADSAIVQQGDFVLEDRSFEGNGKPFTRKVLTVVLPTDVFLSMIAARKVQIKVGPDTYKLNSSEWRHVQVLAKTITPLPN
ncbi:MAG: hypothetical protein QOJ64_1838 [Acidobacteriota bacterium]|jgi:hypothetical protein|nr:hypothetical protein [Acidobacteriota bacterium]